jgi:AcrR family transcriptional regulator
VSAHSLPEPPEPDGLRERKKHRQRERILEVTLELIRERGYDAATVEEIVRRLEISQPTFYNYFSSKDAVLFEVARRAARQWVEVMHSDLAAGAATRDRLDHVRKVMCDWIAADKALWRAVIRANALNLFNHVELLESQAAGLGFVQQIIAEGQARGELTRRFTAQHLTDVLEGMQSHAFARWAADFPEPHSLDRSLRENFEFFMRAAGPDGSPGAARRTRRSDRHG